jgi:hypothetical protein
LGRTQKEEVVAHSGRYPSIILEEMKREMHLRAVDIKPTTWGAEMLISTAHQAYQMMSRNVNHHGSPNLPNEKQKC